MSNYFTDHTGFTQPHHQQPNLAVLLKQKTVWVKILHDAHFRKPIIQMDAEYRALPPVLFHCPGERSAAICGCELMEMFCSGQVSLRYSEHPAENSTIVPDKSWFLRIVNLKDLRS